MRKILALVALVAALGFTGSLIAETPAGAWAKPTISVTPGDCGENTLHAHNPEGTPAKVVASNVFTVGSTIPANGDLSKTITGTASFMATLTVDFPDHATADPVLVTFTTCPQDTTTTSTTPQESTTTTAPAPPPEVQCLGQPPHERTTGEEPCEPPMVTQPHFTG